MNKDYDEYVVMGECKPTEKNNIKIPPETAKDTLKEGVSIEIAKDDTKNLVIQAQQNICRGIDKNGKASNRILRDGRDIKARRNNEQHQDER